MIAITLESISWLNTPDDSPGDKCAHGRVRFCVDDVELVEPTEEWTVSAAAIYLLRTLETDHTQTNPVGEHLFPCCGHSLYDDGTDNVQIIGCENGIDFKIEHSEAHVTITDADQRPFLVPSNEYTHAVLQFSKSVRDFYDASAPKTFSNEHDEAGFKKMISEWERRHPRGIAR